MDYKKLAIKINDELIESINCTLIGQRLIGLHGVVPLEVYSLIKNDLAATRQKTEAWLVAAKKRKQKLEEGRD